MIYLRDGILRDRKFPLGVLVYFAHNDKSSVTLNSFFICYLELGFKYQVSADRPGKRVLVIESQHQNFYRVRPWRR